MCIRDSHRAGAAGEVAGHGLWGEPWGGARLPGLSPEAIAAYVEGWAEANRGCLAGGAGAMAGLQVLLRRAGAGHTLLERGAHCSSLVVDAEAWPGAGHSWVRRLHGGRLVVVEVESLGSRPGFQVELLDAGAAAVAANTAALGFRA